ncbi:hypothetical protein KFL_002590100 [Klebsormidium nitens]|uniref:Uncharacterized protein n=1 Tax=Klebsormidium nitens TaxID=105231 RepID=A0A1Y1I7H4_KLENI|nr:hypothetical protein KFL_002590100 [Klebsormidium nitens]|eukprot:GAQ85882.1 hypothetical protein KFL_002590100 [Klebsormidium nitens]
MEEDRPALFPFLLLCLAVIAADVLLVMSFNPPSFSSREARQITDSFQDEQTKLLSDPPNVVGVVLPRCMDQATGDVLPSLNTCAIAGCDRTRGCAGFVYQVTKEVIKETGSSEAPQRCCMILAPPFSAKEAEGKKHGLRSSRRDLRGGRALLTTGDDCRVVPDVSNGTATSGACAASGAFTHPGCCSIACVSYGYSISYCSCTAAYMTENVTCGRGGSFVPACCRSDDAVSALVEARNQDNRVFRSYFSELPESSSDRDVTRTELKMTILIVVMQGAVIAVVLGVVAREFLSNRKRRC